MDTIKRLSIVLIFWVACGVTAMKADSISDFIRSFWARAAGVFTQTPGNCVMVPASRISSDYSPTVMVGEAVLNGNTLSCIPPARNLTIVISKGGTVLGTFVAQ